MAPGESSVVARGTIGALDYLVRRRPSRRALSFCLEDTVYEITASQNDTYAGPSLYLIDMLEQLLAALRSVVNDLRKRYPQGRGQRFVSFALNSPKFRYRPLFTGFYDLHRDVNLEDLILRRFHNLLQSYRELELVESQLLITATICSTGHSQRILAKRHATAKKTTPAAAKKRSA